MTKTLALFSFLLLTSAHVTAQQDSCNEVLKSVYRVDYSSSLNFRRVLTYTDIANTSYEESRTKFGADTVLSTGGGLIPLSGNGEHYQQAQQAIRKILNRENINYSSIQDLNLIPDQNVLSAWLACKSISHGGISLYLADQVSGDNGELIYKIRYNVPVGGQPNLVNITDVEVPADRLELVSSFTGQLPPSTPRNIIVKRVGKNGGYINVRSAELGDYEAVIQPILPDFCEEDPIICWDEAGPDNTHIVGQLIEERSFTYSNRDQRLARKEDVLRAARAMGGNAIVLNDNWVNNRWIAKIYKNGRKGPGCTGVCVNGNIYTLVFKDESFYRN